MYVGATTNSIITWEHLPENTFCGIETLKRFWCSVKRKSPSCFVWRWISEYEMFHLIQLHGPARLLNICMPSNSPKPAPLVSIEINLLSLSKYFSVPVTMVSISAATSIGSTRSFDQRKTGLYVIVTKRSTNKQPDIKYHWILKIRYLLQIWPCCLAIAIVIQYNGRCICHRLKVFRKWSLNFVAATYKW